MNEILDPTQAFESLRAELEAPWLCRVFLAPREFGLMIGPQSVLIMGEEGAGKTAIEMQLKAYAAQKAKPGLLVVAWRLELSAMEPVGEVAADIFMPQAMDALSFAFLRAVVRSPGFYISAPAYARRFMPWFIQRYLKEDREYNLSRLEEYATAEGLSTAVGILSAGPYEFSYTDPAEVLPHLMGALKPMGFEGVWFFLEGLDSLFHRHPKRVQKFLKDFLSTLEYFEEPAFVFKVVASNELGMLLQETRGVVTRRFKVYQLKWRDEDLAGMIEKRAAVTLGREKLALGELVSDPAWQQWIRRYGGNTPRGWLRVASPILTAYMEKGHSLTKGEWLDVYRQAPPLLRLDLEAERVYIGSGEIPVLAIGYRLLSYLYRNRGRSCSKSELYYCAHKELEREPRSRNDAGWEEAVDWEGILDTALWRLRQAVEWDPRRKATPVYIVSERGRGQIRLENAG